ncbi:MAG TPA: thiamine-phosphate kinase [Candidatus Binataceae bacterium]|nr:thiamine-phosphate kinase [Candidatus Binataceae bacterium]
MSSRSRRALPETSTRIPADLPGLPRSKEKTPPGEFELIARLCAGLKTGRRTLIGPGDDCAALAPIKRPLLVTIDSMVEGVHFRLPWFQPEILGRKALTVNLSDIAACGGWPVACVVNLALPDHLESHFLERLYAGLRRAAAAAELDLVGGNITRGGALAITIALIGEARRSILRRDAARRGDQIFVTGTIGDAAAGLRILEAKLRARGVVRRFLVERFLNPTARLRAGQRLSAIRPAPAAVDLSDGLWQDLGHILEASRVAAEIDADSIPLSAAYRAAVGDDPELALGGGEDYELLFCTRAGWSEAQLTRRLGVAVHRIGRIVPGTGGIRLVGGRGSVRPPRIAGFDQLRSRGRGAP